MGPVTFTIAFTSRRPGLVKRVVGSGVIDSSSPVIGIRNGKGSGFTPHSLMVANCFILIFKPANSKVIKGLNQLKMA